MGREYDDQCLLRVFGYKCTTQQCLRRRSDFGRVEPDRFVERPRLRDTGDLESARSSELLAESRTHAVELRFELGPGAGEVDVGELGGAELESVG